MEELKHRLHEFNYYKQMILEAQKTRESNNKFRKRNAIVETKDGSHAIIHQHIKRQPIPGLSANIEDIERITIFIDGKEYEFVACQ
jgi:hypothetical protein